MIDALYNTMQYRKYYYGIDCEKRLSLKDAAAKVSIKKKTLDDYYIQLKTAYLTGFSLDNPQLIHMG